MFEKKLSFSFSDTQKILKLISQIDNFKGKWSLIERDKNMYLHQLKKIATIQSIGSSTRIEGVTLSDKEIKEIINNVKIESFETRDEQEIIGYYNTLEIIFENYSEIKITENYIKQLHSQLLKFVSKDGKHKGRYKSLPNKVAATYPDGTQKIIFNTTEPFLVKDEMNYLIKETNKNLKLKEIHPLLIIGTFVYEFLSIHPFQDGNGRLSRLLTTLLLLKEDYPFVKYISLEHVIENKKSEYYKALMECQKKRGTKEKEIITKWIVFFLQTIIDATIKLNIKYNNYIETGAYLNERQKKIKKIIEENEPLKIIDIHKYIDDISINTLKKDVKLLCNQNVIEKIGELKGAKYIITKNASV